MCVVCECKYLKQKQTQTQTQEGFIFTTIYGTAFCYSSLCAVKLIWSNAIRAAMLEGISHWLEVIGRVTIAALTTGLCVLILNEHKYYQNQLSSVLAPSLVIFVLALLIASLFMLVYEVAVDAIFLSYLIDESAHNGTAKFAHSELAAKTTAHRNSV